MTRLKRLATGVALLVVPAVWSAASAQEVVQPLPPAGTDELNGALRRLAADPRDVTALLDAGDAALKVGDIDGAMGFYGRARDLSPENARVKMGMATAFARTRRPVEALRLFAEAETAGADPAAMAEDRGLAFDLVGDAASAQANYRLAIPYTKDPELVRRLALSQAISGDRAGFEATLLPLLQKQDLAAFRTRAFGLAILGDVDDAVKIAQGMMPREMAARMTPYLETMPQLTQAQQAAAGNLGVFPRGARLAAASAHPAPRSPAPTHPAASSATTARVAATTAPREAVRRDDSQTRDWQGRVRPRGNRDEQRATELAQADRAKDNPRVPLPPPIPSLPSLPAPSSSVPSKLPTVASSSAATGAPAQPSPQSGELQPVSEPRASAVDVWIERQALASAPAAGVSPSTASNTAAGGVSSPPSAELPTIASVTPANGSVPPSPQATQPPPIAASRASAVDAWAARQAATPAGVPPTPTAQQASASPPPIAAPRASAVDAWAARQAAAPAGVPPTPTAQQASVSPPSAAPPPTPSPSPEPQPAEEISLADAFASFVLPSAPAPAARAGAVDITAIRIPREVAEPEPGPAKPEPAAKPEAKKPEPKKAEPKKPAKPAQPARQWVQVATGKNLAALKFDWGRIARKANGKLDKKGPFTTSWVEANRLLAGPFDSPAAAKEMVKQLKAIGLDAFTYSSPEGEEIKPLK